MINIARQIYSGWNITSTTYDLPEAEIVPIGTSSNEKKKIEKFIKSHTVIKEFDNIPLPGFTLYKTNRKKWGSHDPTWLIIDPRGFLVRISNENLEEILYVTGITEGLIQQKCIWARDDSKTAMKLVPVTSETYTEAVENTELIEGKISAKDVQIGDKVLLQNKLVGRYMGTQSLYGPLNEYPYKGGSKPQVSLRRQIIEVDPHKFHYQADIKMLKVLEKTANPLTKQEAADYMNTAIRNDSTTYFTNTPNTGHSYYSTRGMISHVSTYAVLKPKVSFVEITKDEAKEIYKASYLKTDIGQMILEEATGARYVLKHPYSIRNAKIPPLEFEIHKINLPTLDEREEIMISHERFNYGSPKISKVYTLDNFVKFYKIIKHVKNETYI